LSPAKYAAPIHPTAASKSAPTSLRLRVLQRPRPEPAASASNPLLQPPLGPPLLPAHTVPSSLPCPSRRQRSALGNGALPARDPRESSARASPASSDRARARER